MTNSVKPNKDEIAKVSAKPITDRLADLAREIRDRHCREKCGEVCDKPSSLLLIKELIEQLWEDYAKWN